MNKLAVLIPVYQNQAGLDRSLVSLRDAHGEFDTVVIDDGSSQPIHAAYESDGPGGVLVTRMERNGGIAAALNFGLRHILAKGYTYVARLDAGDTVVPERLERQMRFLDLHSDCGAVSSFVDFVDRVNVPLFRYRPPCTYRKILDRLHLGNCLVHSGVMIRAHALGTIGLYREDLPFAEDYELFLSMARHYTLAVLPEVLTRCEYSLSGLSVTGRRRHQKERLKLQLRYFDPVSPYSFYGVARTLLAMVVPHWAVLRVKQAYFR
jgi:glycosyltransferase involved in cell wall biosynthesis